MENLITVICYEQHNCARLIAEARHHRWLIMGIATWQWLFVPCAGRGHSQIVSAETDDWQASSAETDTSPFIMPWLELMQNPVGQLRAGRHVVADEIAFDLINQGNGWIEKRASSRKRGWLNSWWFSVVRSAVGTATAIVANPAVLTADDPGQRRSWPPAIFPMAGPSQKRRLSSLSPYSDDAAVADIAGSACTRAGTGVASVRCLITQPISSPTIQQLAQKWIGT